MKKPTRKLLYNTVNVIAIALIIECFLCSMLLVQKYARESCFERIEETTAQMSTMFQHSMEQYQEKLTVFADILAANVENPDELVKTHMKNFCQTQSFSAVCIHRRNGTSISYGDHPHDALKDVPFEDEIRLLPYVSDVFFYGKDPADNYVYQAVPIIRRGETVAILYGYISLEIMPGFVVSSAYDGKCQLYVVDGNTGNFLMDEYHGELGNIFDGTMGDRETKPGYDLDEMCIGMEQGKSGYLIFRSKRTGVWYYTYYMPLGINNWSMQLTIDEPTAFAAYDKVHNTMFGLMFCVLSLLVVLILSLMIENNRVSKLDKARLKQTGFVNSVQQSLLNAYTNSDAVVTALRTVAEEVGAETVLLLSFTDNVVQSAQYWPSTDKAQAMDLLGRNIREEFPVLYDRIALGSSVVYDRMDPQWDISQTATEVFRQMDVSRLILVPILDNCDQLKGAISAVNVPQDATPELIESVVYDFFMAITNLESHSIIKKMGAFDYLTGMKNRNSFETEHPEFATLPGESLWCTYVDVNGLHELNNRDGHKAGDRMLCTVADTIRRIMGGEWAYRLGGDEFVVFKENMTHEEMMSLKYRVLNELERKGYSVSVGFAGAVKNRNGVFDVEQVLQEAEEFMYQDKREYYEKNNISTERKHPAENRKPKPE